MQYEIIYFTAMKCNKIINYQPMCKRNEVYTCSLVTVPHNPLNTFYCMIITTDSSC